MRVRLSVVTRDPRPATAEDSFHVSLAASDRLDGDKMILRNRHSMRRLGRLPHDTALVHALITSELCHSSRAQVHRHAST